MMKRFLFAALALAATIPTAFTSQAQDDDDIYFSKKANKQAKYDAIYATAVADSWSTEANNDWDLDDYNRRGKETAAPSANEIAFAEDAPFYYEVIDEKGDTIKIPGNSKMLQDADLNKYKIKKDTVVLVEQYYFSDLIRRFHNPYFGYYRYSPWYDVAYYDPFYWDYCYYDPWWYVTPSFGFHWGNWYGGWSYGYYSGWYGGWYSPFYSPNPHYYHCNYYYHFGYDGYYHAPSYGPLYNYASGSAHRGSSRNNFGGHFAHRGGWKGDGGSSSRLASASTNRSYRAANGARVGFTNSNGTYTAGPSLRGRNTVNGRLANSNMRSHANDISNSSGITLGASRGGNITGTSGNNGSYSSRTHTASRVDRNNANRVTRDASEIRSNAASSIRNGNGNVSINDRPGRSNSRRSTYASSNRGISSFDNSSSRRSENTYTPSRSSSASSSSSYNNSTSRYSGSSYDNSSSRSYNNSSNNTRSSYSSGSSSSYSSGSSYSGGGSSHSSGGSHSSGSSHGRR